jgi:hypothetical protein
VVSGAIGAQVFFLLHSNPVAPPAPSNRRHARIFRSNLTILAHPGLRGTRGVYMKKAIAIFAVILMAALNVSFAEETAFSGCKLADVKGKQAEARLIFSDEAKSVIVRSMDRDVVSIPYVSIDKFSYDYAKKHRITQGAIVMEQNAPKSVVLRMDKSEYRKIFDAVKTHTGKDVQFVGEAGKNKDKDKNNDKANGKDKDSESFR